MDSVSSRTGAGSGVDSVRSQTGVGSGVDSVSSRTGAGSGVDSVSSRTGAGSGVNSAFLFSPSIVAVGGAETGENPCRGAVIGLVPSTEFEPGDI